MDIQEILNQKINVKAVAREYPVNARPMLNPDWKTGKADEYIPRYLHGKHGLVMELDGDEIRPVREVPNTSVFVTQGKNWLGDVMIGVKATTLTHVAVGSGTTAPLVSDTNVETIIGARHVYTDRFRSSNIVTVSTFFASGDNNGTWGNAGIFTDLTAGDMFAHSKFAATVTKNSGNTQTLDFDLTVS